MTKTPAAYGDEQRLRERLDDEASRLATPIGAAGLDGEADEAAAREETASANELMLALLRAGKGVRTYLPNNPMRIRFLDELQAGLTAHLERYGDFRIDVEQFTISYRGARIYENRDARESLAWRLHADGIRSLCFSPEVEPREVGSLLEILATAAPDGEDDDIVTRLWEQSLPNISCLLEEDFIESGGGQEAEPASQQEAISRIFAYNAESPPGQPAAARAIPKHLLMLTGDEVKWLQRAKQSEIYRNPREDAIAVVCSILAGEREPELFADFVTIAADMATNLLFTGDIGWVLKLVRFLARLASDGTRGEQQHAAIAGALAGFLTERTVQRLQETLDSGETVTVEELKELLLLLGLPSLDAICDLLGRVEKLKLRKGIVEVLVELGRDDPRVFAPHLADQRWFLVRNLVLVLSMLDSPVTLEMIAGLVSHREQRVRREVLGFLQRSTDPKAKNYLLKFLRDDSSALRIRALQVIARERLSFGLKTALALAAADDFRSRKMLEKTAIYEAIGELGTERELPLFRALLLKRHWFNRQLERENVLLAVAGLTKMKSEAAFQLLVEGQRRRTPEIREIIDQAIAGFTAADGEPPESSQRFTWLKKQDQSG